jgi:hypothetical protein
MKRIKTGGRTKGTPNRLTTSIKEALLETFDRRGGTQALLDWSNDHPSDFYALVGRLIPKEPSVESSAVTIRIVRTSPETSLQRDALRDDEVPARRELQSDQPALLQGPSKPR